MLPSGPLHARRPRLPATLHREVVVLIDRYLPTFDAHVVAQTFVDAPLDITFAAIRETDLRDHVIDGLFLVRELPERIRRRLMGEPPAPHERKPVTLADITDEGPGWVMLEEQPGVEFVVGSVGRFWRLDYGGVPVTREEFLAFTEPGYAKLAISFSVAVQRWGSVLRYEARTATTDEDAARRFKRYWTFIEPGVELVMRRVIRRIREEAEQRAGVTAGA